MEEVDSNWKAKVRRLLTVEPVIFLFYFADTLSDPCTQALMYNKLCFIITNGSSACDNLHNESNRELEKQVQTDASHWFLYRNLAYEIPSILIAFVYGTLSDHFNRKVALIAPLVGQMISMSNWIVVSVNPTFPMWTVLIGPLVSGFFGGWVTNLVGCMSYLSDVTSKETRTARVAVAEWVLSMALSIGLFLSGFYLDNTSYHTVLSTTLVLYFLSFLYIIVWLKEPESRTIKSTTCRNICVHVLGPQAIIGTFKTIFRKREQRNRRKHLIALFFCLLMGYLALQPSWSLGYLFTKKYPLSWSQTTYGIYTGYNEFISGLALLTIGPIMKKRLGMHETAMMMLSIVTSAIGELMFGFCTKTWMVFGAATLSLFSGVRVTVQRALMSTMVEKDELGQMFAVFGSIQSVGNLIAHNVYNTLYPVSLNFWPGFCFALGASISIIPLSVYIWLHNDMKKTADVPTYTEMSTTITEGDEEDNEIEQNGYGGNAEQEKAKADKPEDEQALMDHVDSDDDDFMNN